MNGSFQNLRRKTILEPLEPLPCCSPLLCLRVSLISLFCSCSKSWRWRFVIMFQGGAALYDQHVSLAPGDQAAATGRRGGLQVWNHFPRSSRGMCSGAVRQPHCTEWVYIHIERVACADKSPAAAYIFVTPVLASAPGKLSPPPGPKISRTGADATFQSHHSKSLLSNTKESIQCFFYNKWLKKNYYKMLNYYHLKLKSVRT